MGFSLLRQMAPGSPLVNKSNVASTDAKLLCNYPLRRFASQGANRVHLRGG